jgi:adenylate cyclase
MPKRVLGFNYIKTLGFSSPNNKKFLVRIAILIAGLVIAAVFHLRIAPAGLALMLEYPLRDIVVKTLSGRSVPEEVVLVDIDELSIKERGGWPWSRSDLSYLSQTLLNDYNAKIVAFDIVLPEARDEIGDRRLLQLAEERKIVLSQVFDYVKRDTPIKTGELAFGHSIIANPGADAILATGFIGNHSGLSQAPCVGNIGFIPDEDGKLRRIIHLTSFNTRIFLSLAYEIAACIGLAPNKTPSAVALLRFDIAQEQWAVIPALDFFRVPLGSVQSDPLKTLVQQKIVIVGSSALGLSDRIATPLSSSTSGMFVHAQALSEILASKRSIPPELSTPISLITQLAIVLAFGLALIRFEKPAYLWFSLATICLVWLGLITWQILAGSHLNQSAALWAFLIFGLFLMPFEWFSTRKKVRYVSSMLERYVSKKIFSEVMLIEDISLLKPKTAEITVLVVDMVAYAKTVSSQSLEVAAEMTRDFIAEITDPVWQCEGTIDRYTGDGLIAFWGAPIEQKSHAELALQAAALIQQRIAALNIEKLSKLERPQISIRIGIASGVAIVGDFGTKERANYTAVGNCINMASRLESKAKELNMSILVSQSTAMLVNYRDLREVQSVELRGLGMTTLYTLSSSMTR